MVTLLHHPHERCDSKAYSFTFSDLWSHSKGSGKNSHQTFSRIPPDLAFRTPWNGWDYSPLHHGITRFIWWKNNFFELPTKQTYQSVSGPMPFSSESSCKSSNDDLFSPHCQEQVPILPIKNPARVSRCVDSEEQLKDEMHQLDCWSRPGFL